jgi:hypothetical protein
VHVVGLAGPRVHGARVRAAVEWGAWCVRSSCLRIPI